MSYFQRLDPTFLRRGAVIDLNDLRTDEAIEHYKDLYFTHLPTPPGQRVTPFFTVDHLIRIDPDNYEVVPQGPWTVDEARELGLLINTRHIERIHRRGSGSVRITDLAYETLRSLGAQALSGVELLRHFVVMEGSRPVRPQHRYVNLNTLAHFVALRVLRLFPQPRRYLDHQHLFEVMMQSKTLHEFARPVFLLQPSRDAFNPQPQQVVFVDVDMKSLDRWLRRHQSSFYQSAERHQKLLDDMDDAIDTRRLQALADDAKAPLEMTAAEADALGILDEGELSEEADAPDFNFLPTPEPGQRNDEEL